MAHSETSRVQDFIGDPISEKPAVDRAELESIFNDIQTDMRFDHELNGCLNCGICTATWWTENLEGIYDAMQEKIWSCAQCYTCAARCPFGNSPGGLVMLMREVAIKHQMQSAKDVLRPFSRVMLKLISTGNQLSPDMINPQHFADWGPNISKVDAPLKVLRKAIPMATLNTTDTAWEVNLKTSVELYTIWEMSGVVNQLEGIDENLFDVISDIMSEKREDWKDFLEDQDD
ncbi:MAG: heterodisulfide reductase subunit C [Hyphomicrobium denitrificans]|nr:heterodisulfide reductase subunit C [Hyphomicrobium denitrificans]